MITICYAKILTCKSMRNNFQDMPSLESGSTSGDLPNILTLIDCLIVLKNSKISPYSSVTHSLLFPCQKLCILVTELSTKECPAVKEEKKSEIQCKQGKEA